ncbi:MAG: hypothetical protein U0Q55_15545 [Vicinamibacterales bacterium]
MNRIQILAFSLCTLLTLGSVARAQSTPTQLTVPFSDPSRPGTVRVSVLSGSVTVKPGTAKEVIVTTSRGSDDDAKREREREREREIERQAERRNRGRGSDDSPSTDGMRRLTQPAGVSAEEENNVISISSPVWSNASTIVVQVPPATSVVVRAVNGGEVSVEGISGSIEVNNVNGSIRITDVSGPVIAHATNGRVVASLRQVPAGKPMSFTSFNGNVDVTLPAAAKANLKLRSDRGDVYTDFDVQTSAAAPRVQTPDSRRDDRGRGRDDDPKDKGKYRIEMDRSIFGSINGGGPDFELRTFNGNIYLRKNAR